MIFIQRRMEDLNLMGKKEIESFLRKLEPEVRQFVAEKLAQAEKMVPGLSITVNIEPTFTEIITVKVSGQRSRQKIHRLERLVSLEEQKRILQKNWGDEDRRKIEILLGNGGEPVTVEVFKRKLEINRVFFSTEFTNINQCLRNWGEPFRVYALQRTFSPSRPGYDAFAKYRLFAIESA